MSLQLNGTDGVTFNDGSEQWAAASPIGTKNLIINGDMRIDQRNGGSSVTPSNNDYCLDRYGTGLAQASKYSVQQVTDAPTNFTHSLKVTSLSAYTLLAGDYFMIKHKIEGNNVAHLNLGSANAQEFTLSFYVKSSLTGTFGGSLENSNESRAYPFTYTISSANTWERVSVTLTGDTTGTWLTDNSTGLWINFGLGVGTTYSGTADAWTTGPKVSATGATSVVSTNAATWQMTGVQLEVGDTATPFEHRPYDMELLRCKRYYHKIAGNTTDQVLVSSGGHANTTTFRGHYIFQTTMRSAPTISYADIEVLSTNVETVSALSTFDEGVCAIGFNITTSTATTNAYGYTRLKNVATAYIDFSSEL